MSGETGRVWWHHIRREEHAEAGRPSLPEIGGVNRRLFVKGVACCLVATALPAAATESGSGEPAAATLPLPVEPLRLDFDDGMVLIDPAFVLDESMLPTQRERISRLEPGFAEVPREAEIAWLEENGWMPYWVVAFPEDVVPWLDSKADVLGLGMVEFPEFSEYGAGIRLWQELGPEADRLGLRLVECPVIGSGFVGVRFDGDPRVLNAALARLGINVVVSTRGREDEPEGEEEQGRDRERVKQHNAAREAGRRPSRGEG